MVVLITMFMLAAFMFHSHFVALVRSLLIRIFWCVAFHACFEQLFMFDAISASSAQYYFVCVSMADAPTTPPTAASAAAPGTPPAIDRGRRPNAAHNAQAVPGTPPAIIAAHNAQAVPGTPPHIFLAFAAGPAPGTPGPAGHQPVNPSPKTLNPPYNNNPSTRGRTFCNRETPHGSQRQTI